MLAMLITIATFFLAVVQATPADIEIRKTKAVVLPQCGNLTLTWSTGVAPYTAVITDVTTGLKYALLLQR